MNEIRRRGWRVRATSVRQAAARRRCATPAVSEALERRCLLSTTYYTVSGTGDGAGSMTGGDGSQNTPYVYTTLRGAITAAVADGGTDTIGFDSTVFNTPRTITLSSMLPIITDDLTIDGPGENLLTISGDANSGCKEEYGSSGYERKNNDYNRFHSKWRWESIVASGRVMHPIEASPRVR